MVRMSVVGVIAPHTARRSRMSRLPYESASVRGSSEPASVVASISNTERSASARPSASAEPTGPPPTITMSWSGGSGAITASEDGREEVSRVSHAGSRARINDSISAICFGASAVSTSQPPGIYESLGAKVDLGETDSLYLEQLRERLGDKALINIGYLASADINSDGLVNINDWTRFKSGQGMNLAGMSPAQAYSWGDLNGDFKQDLNDFVAFRRAYIAFNGAPAFDQLVAGVPEPSTLWLATLVFASWLIRPRGPNQTM